jgi:hypothetical protein
MNSITRELLAYLDEQRAVLKSAFDAVPAELRAQAPAPERWSAVNVVEHLAIVEARVAKLLTQRIDEARAGLPPAAPGGAILPTINYQRMYDRSTRVKASDISNPTGLDSAAAWAALESAGSMLRAMLAANDGVDLSSVKHPHPRFGELSVYEWTAFLGAHEVRHADQIREDNPAKTKTAGL